MSTGPLLSRSSYYDSSRSVIPDDLADAFNMLYISPVTSYPTTSIPPPQTSMTTGMATTSQALQFPGDKATTIDPGSWLGKKEDFHF